MENSENYNPHVENIIENYPNIFKEVFSLWKIFAMIINDESRKLPYYCLLLKSLNKLLLTCASMIGGAKPPSIKREEVKYHGEFWLACQSSRGVRKSLSCQWLMHGARIIVSVSQRITLFVDVNSNVSLDLAKW